MTTDTPRTDAEVFELQDCNGQLRKVITTQFARQLERELSHSLADQLAARNDAFNLANALSKSEAELIALQRLRPTRDDVEKLQDEVDRLKKRPFGCKCETLREKALGDGCDECNKALVIEMLTDEQYELEAEVERLLGIANRAISALVIVTYGEASIDFEWPDIMRKVGELRNEFPFIGSTTEESSAHQL